MNNIELAKNVWESLKGSTAKAKKFADLVAVSFSLLSEENEDIFVVVRDGQLMVEPYHYDDNNCEVEASADIIAKMFTGELAFDKALSDGSVQIKSGDPAKLKALECLVPSKKSAAKKAPAAKSAKAAEKPAAKAAEKPAAKVADKPAEKAAVKAETKPEVKAEEKKAAPAAKKSGKKK
ncbi:MAG: SCP2 sterol-binding domain-containing protein [Oscillospiraceae bacterium]|nr:SCP2 sterol-binding domain-containing protein [Oscillospiraceae bacterium]